MNGLELLASLLALCGGVFFAGHRALRYLRIMQQDEYAPERFWAWFKGRRAADTRGSAVVLAAFVLSLPARSAGAHCLIAASALAALLFIAGNEGDPRTTGKLKLVMTARARRIYITAALCFLLAALALAAILSAIAPAAGQRWIWLMLFALFQAVPFCLIAAVRLLAPSERRVQERFFREAAERMARFKPFTIGVTGSYGKTSVKNMLGEVLLACKGATFWPGKGTNTIMGNTRAIREGLRETHEYAIIEMGAYRRGTIARVCELAPPQAAILTAVASMHLERFGSREEIYQAKTELARAVPESGLLICNADDDFTRRAAAEFRKARTLLYGFAADADCRIVSRASEPEGTAFRISWQGREFDGFTQLLGRPALSNIAAVFTAACALGCDPELALGAIRNLKPVENRLSVQRSGEVIFLNDAYNSNPIGFAAALEVLAQMPGARRILMTPGMVELGAEQAEENRRAAEGAGLICQLALVVGDANREALQSGLRAGGLAAEQILCFKHRDQALAELKRLQRAGDVILIENDLTDWYEDRARF